MKRRGTLAVLLVAAMLAWVSIAPAAHASTGDDLGTRLDTVWVLLCAALVFVMQAGFLCLESGLARAKNSINVAIKNMADFVFAIVGFWACGFALMFGATEGGLIGTSGFFADFDDPWAAVFFVFQAMFVGTAATIDGGAVAERTRFSAYVISSLVISVLIYPIFGHWAWGGGTSGEAQGWLEVRGFHDFAGSTVVHSVGGWVALAGIAIVGPRIGRFDADGRPLRLQPSSMQTAYLGTFILFFGWFGFNCGSTLAATTDIGPIAFKTMLSGSVGGISSGLVSRLRDANGHYDAGHIINGVLGGLVAITAGCDSVGATGAIAIGVVAGLVVYFGSLLLELLRVDDVVGAVPVHGMCGAWGTMAVALFSKNIPGDFSRLQYLGIQSLGVATAFVWAFGTGLLMFGLLQRFMTLRVNAEDEIRGLNVAEHGATSGLLQLARSMVRGTETGRYGDSLRVEPEHGTEVGDLGTCFNDMVGAIQRERAATIAEKERVELLLDSTGDALLSVSFDGRVELPVSRAALDWFGAPREHSVWDYLCSSEAQRLEFRLAFEQIADGFLPFELAAAQMPHRLQTKDKHLDIEYRLVERAGQNPRILLIVEDVTETVHGEALERQIEELREVVGHVVRSPEEFLAFVTDTERLLHALVSECGPTRRKLQLHTLKGNAACFGFESVAVVCHQIEDAIDKGEFTTALLEGLREAWQAALERVSQFVPNGDQPGVNVSKEELQQFSEKLKERADLEPLERIVEGWLYVPTRRGLSRLERQARTLATRLGKQIEVHIEDEGLRVEPGALDELWDVLLHAIRNAIDHGIESPEERLAAGKRRAGALVLRTALQDDQFVLSITDDGRGIDWETIRARADERGLPAATHQHLVDALFSEGLSTADRVTQISGRGVGVSAIGVIVESRGGTCTYISSTGKGTTLVCRVPRGSTRIAERRCA